MQTPAYKGPSARGVCRAEKTVDGVIAQGVDVKRVEHAAAVVTTTHPVAVRHVNNNMAPAQLPSHSPFRERISFFSVLKVSQNRTHGLQARISPA
jgi:hypothetical protein